MVDALFKNRKLNPARLLSYGFIRTQWGYRYSEKLNCGNFEMAVNISDNGKVSAEIFDTNFREEYVLHRIPGSFGEFVGAVREEYGRILVSIAENCFDRCVFKSPTAEMIVKYIKERYRNEPEFLWEKFPGNAVFRCTKNLKWYAVMLTIKKSKLGVCGKENIEIIDLRADPAEIEAITDEKLYFPGYHMNKKHWFTICLDGSVPADEICRRIDVSYKIALKSR